ncbi:TlpA family protein disulfide reductase [Agromyces atrinae]|uniref:Thiol-disulfide isomerase/thioredoxin n=1 Tax=Agromyces atrinae TaxID=592376 RepID=A0A4Q2M435_9MICO|nr:TlpA disulfide reductase family protein [Agromyces atrinae]NYD67371.1 thiol-disulfide isomerase/thioredoxin [Agromyces atrinae]RXZ86805.1 TlpA family protein disulfide reductase [Agromyces atrinae]
MTSVRLRTAAVLAAAALLLVGCTSDPLADDYRSGSGKGYISGDGSLTEVAADDRGEPVEFEGTAIDGSAISSADYAGEVLVVNFWYAECAPCRAEAGDLQQLNETFEGEEAHLLGVNVRNQAATAASFEKQYGVTYPSVLDINDGTVQLAFAGEVPPNAVPTTIVLDREGRIAARILGQLRDPKIVETIVGDLLVEAE